MSFLEPHGVGKSHRGACGLRNVDLNVEQGEFVAIIGFSGSGKTTLLSTIAGLCSPDHGEVSS